MIIISSSTSVVIHIIMMMMSMIIMTLSLFITTMKKPLPGWGSAIAPHRQSVKSNLAGLCIRASPASLQTGQAIAPHPTNRSCSVPQTEQIVKPIALPGRRRPSNVKPIAELPTNASNRQARGKPPLASAKVAKSPDYKAIPHQTANVTGDASKPFAVKN